MLISKIDSIQEIIKTDIHFNQDEIKNFKFTFDRSSYNNIIYNLLQVIVSSEFYQLDIRNIIKYFETYSSKFIIKLFKGAIYKTKRITIDNRSVDNLFSKRKSHLLFNFLKVTGMINSLEEIIVFLSFPKEFDLFWTLINEYK